MPPEDLKGDRVILMVAMEDSGLNFHTHDLSYIIINNNDDNSGQTAH